METFVVEHHFGIDSIEPHNFNLLIVNFYQCSSVFKALQWKIFIFVWSGAEGVEENVSFFPHQNFIFYNIDGWMDGCKIVYFPLLETFPTSPFFPGEVFKIRSRGW